MAKTMKDVTGDGKFTYADVLKMRGVKLKKSMPIGGVVNPTGDPEKEPSTASKVKEGWSDFFSDIAATPGIFMNLLREGVDVLSGYDDVEREDRRRLRAVYGSPGTLWSTNQAEWNQLDRKYDMSPEEAARKEAQLKNMKFESAARRFNEGNPHPSDPEFSSMLPEAEVVAIDESYRLPDSNRQGRDVYPMGVNRYSIGSQYGLEPYHGAMGLPSGPDKRRAYPMPTLGPRVNENNLEKLPKSLGYGGKVNLMKRGGTVDYLAGGALAAGLGQLAQRSQNPTVQKLGKVASTIGGLTPGGRAVNMAGNVLQNVIPPAAAQPTQQAAPQQGGGFANFMGSPVGQMAMQALPGLLGFSAKQGMVVPNAKVRLLKLER